MSYRHYELVRLERELRLQQARRRPPGRPRPRPTRPSLPQLPPQLRLRRHRPAPLMQAHEYLELEFAVEE